MREGGRKGREQEGKGIRGDGPAGKLTGADTTVCHPNPPNEGLLPQLLERCLQAAFSCWSLRGLPEPQTATSPRVTALLQCTSWIGLDLSVLELSPSLCLFCSLCFFTQVSVIPRALSNQPLTLNSVSESASRESQSETLINFSLQMDALQSLGRASPSKSGSSGENPGDTSQLHL